MDPARSRPEQNLGQGTLAICLYRSLLPTPCLLITVCARMHAYVTHAECLSHIRIYIYIYIYIRISTLFALSHTYIHTYIQTDRQTDRQTDTDRQTQTDRHRQTQTDRHRQTQTDTDRHRQTQTDRQTETDLHTYRIHFHAAKEVRLYERRRDIAILFRLPAVACPHPQDC